MQTRGGIFQTRVYGFDSLQTRVPGFDYVRPAGGRYRLLIPPPSVEYLSMSEIRDIEKVANTYTVMWAYSYSYLLHSKTAISLFMAASVDLSLMELRSGCVRDDLIASSIHMLLQNNLLVDSDSRRSAVVVVTNTIISSCTTISSSSSLAQASLQRISVLSKAIIRNFIIFIV